MVVNDVNRESSIVNTTPCYLDIRIDQRDAMFIPAGTTHSAENAGATDAGELATYIVEKKKRLVIMAK